jgi:hypothetical protein
MFESKLCDERCFTLDAGALNEPTVLIRHAKFVKEC